MPHGSFKSTCLRLRRQGYSLVEISKHTGRPKTSVYFHIKGTSLPQERLQHWRAEGRKRIIAYNLNRRGKSVQGRTPTPFTSWNPDLVMLVAHYTFDGEVRRTVCAYTNTSSALIERVTTLTRLVYPYPPKTRCRNGVHSISYFNVELASLLQEKRAVLLATIERMGTEHRRAFLRAFFDDEGCVTFHPKRRTRLVRGYQYDEDLRALVRRLLQSFGVETREDRTAQAVVVSGRSNLERFAQEIGFSEGVYMGGTRKNSVLRKRVEKRVLLNAMLHSFQKVTP